MGSIQRETVLFLTNAEHGQANIHFATAYEFLMRDEFDVHIASYPNVTPRVQELNQQVQTARQQRDGKNASSSKAIFHPLSGVNMVDNIKANNFIWPHKTGVGNVTRGYSTMGQMVLREDHHNYLATYDNILEIIKNFNPTIAVVDPMFYTGIDACQMAKLEFVILSPMTFFELSGADQPRAQIFWKYPVVGSGYPYPLPWHLIPLNIWLFIMLIVKFLFGPATRSLNVARKAHGIDIPMGLGRIPEKVHICPSLPEIDYPLAVIPDEVVGVGPILLPILPISQTDPSLSTFLSRPNTKTILINLGTHHVNSPSSAIEMASAFSSLLTSHPNLQILWKLKTQTLPKEFHTLTTPLIKQDRLRISPWLIPETTSIVTHPNVIAFVHHGGANSYYETCYAGLPHVVLPPWFDCYQNAQKVEFLGLGVYANKKDAPDVERREFLAGLEKVVGDEGMSKKARELGVICRAKVGREVACEKIVEVAREKGKKMV